MKHAIRFITPLLFVGLAGVPLSSAGHAHAQVVQWNVEPPNYYNDVGRRAFHDGIEAAHNDWNGHREMDPYHYQQYRRPPVAGPEREHYRDAFLRGYDEGMHRARGWDGDRGNSWRDHDHDQDRNQYPR
jgi:hypothetical protein